jgi:hypothetical protein
MAMLRHVIVLLGYLFVSLSCGSGHEAQQHQELAGSDIFPQVAIPLPPNLAITHDGRVKLLKPFAHPTEDPPRYGLPPGGNPGECMISDAEGEKSWGACYKPE